MPGSTTGTLEPLTPEELDERVAAYHRLAAGRPEPAELNLLVQVVAITDDPAAALRPLLTRQPQLTVDQALELPLVLAGSLEEIVGQVRAARERYGFTYFTVLEPNLEPFGKVIEALRAE